MLDTTLCGIVCFARNNLQVSLLYTSNQKSRKFRLLIWICGPIRMDTDHKSSTRFFPEIQHRQDVECRTANPRNRLRTLLATGHACMHRPTTTSASATDNRGVAYRTETLDITWRHIDYGITSNHHHVFISKSVLYCTQFHHLVCVCVMMMMTGGNFR